MLLVRSSQTGWVRRPSGGVGLIDAQARTFRGFPSAEDQELNVEIVIENGCMFVVNGLIVPSSLRFEGQPYSDGWRLLRSLKSSEIDSRARDCGWNFFFMAEMMKRTVFGFARGSALRRAASKILSQVRTDAFNAVEITEITARQFLGLHCVTVGAHARSLQESWQLKDMSARRRELAMCVPGAERL